MKKPMFSIIVPVYNAEKYLEKCINSLLNQTYKDIEIILVDDGSTDGSAKICDEYAINENNITVVHKNNGGVATARNRGLKLSKGEFIAFVDADDFLDVDAYEKIYKVIKNQNPDCIDFGWKYINVDGEISNNLHKLEKNRLLGKREIKTDILPPLLNLKRDDEHFVYDFSVNKIYKKIILIDNDIYFDETRKLWEDRVFLIKYLKHCESYFSVDRCFYNYVSVPNSLSRRYDMNFFDIILQNYRSYVEWFGEEYDFETKYVYNYWCHSIENMILRSLREKDNKEKIMENIERTLKDEQVVTWYSNREPENVVEKQTSKFVVEGEVLQAVKIYEDILSKQLKKERWKVIKGKLYSIRKVFK